MSKPPPSNRPTQSDLPERTAEEFEEAKAELQAIWRECSPIFERLQIARNQSRFGVFRAHLNRAFREL